MNPQDCLGKSFTVDLYGCQYDILDDKTKVQELLETAAKKAKATVLNVYTHRFAPQGITCLVAISESHIAIHTWPEYNFASVDIYTCGNEAMPDNAKDHIIEVLQPQRQEIKELSRGNVIFLDK
jgi:S-adenosylmethionine decarboxylase proenzyme